MKASLTRQKISDPSGHPCYICNRDIKYQATGTGEVRYAGQSEGKLLKGATNYVGFEQCNIDLFRCKDSSSTRSLVELEINTYLQTVVAVFVVGEKRERLPFYGCKQTNYRPFSHHTSSVNTKPKGYAKTIGLERHNSASIRCGQNLGSRSVFGSKITTKSGTHI